MGSLFQELKRRKVFRVAAVYAIVAWLLIEVTSTILPTFDAPTWVNQTVTLLLLLGFPIALILSWAFEITPEGIKADAAAQPAQLTAQSTDRKLIYAILALVVLVAGFQLADRFSSAEVSAALSSQQLTATVNTDSRVIRSRLDLGPMQAFRGEGLRTLFSLSPDGTMLAYTTIIDGDTSSGDRQLHLLDLSQLESRKLGPPFFRPIINPTLQPVIDFSPDGEWVAYSSGSTLMKISVAGGTPVKIADDVVLYGDFWTQQDTIIVTNSAFRLVRISVESGDTEPLALAQEFDFEILRNSVLMPDGKNILFHRVDISPNAAETRLQLYNLETGENRVLLTEVGEPRYSNSGHLTFIRDGSLSAVPFDLETLQITGPEVTLIDNIEGDPVFGQYSYALSESGDLVYLPGASYQMNLVPLSSLSWVELNGDETVLDMEPQAFLNIGLSPDGRNVLLTIIERPGILDIYNYDLDRGALARVTFTRSAMAAVWNAEGDRIVYGTMEGEIYSVNANGLGNTELLFDGTLNNAYALPTSFSPDGSQAFFSEIPRLSFGESKIFSLNMSPEGETEKLFESDFFESAASISPNGRWLAYRSNESGSQQIHVRPYPATNTNRWQVSIEGGNDPQWSADSEQLFFRRSLGADGSNSEMYSVSVATGDVFKAGQPQLLFTSDHINTEVDFGFNTYSVSPDGERFLMLKPATDQSEASAEIPTSVILIQNFAAELKRLVPARLP